MGSEQSTGQKTILVMVACPQFPSVSFVTEQTYPMILLHICLTPKKNVKKQQFEHCDITSKVYDLWKGDQKSL